MSFLPPQRIFWPRTPISLWVWFGFAATTEVMKAAFIDGNNCQPGWAVMLKPSKSLFNHSPCISIQALVVEH